MNTYEIDLATDGTYAVTRTRTGETISFPGKDEALAYLDDGDLNPERFTITQASATLLIEAPGPFTAAAEAGRQAALSESSFGTGPVDVLAVRRRFTDGREACPVTAIRKRQHN